MQIVDVGSEMLAHTRQAVAQARNLSFPVYDGRHSGCGQHRVDELEAAYGDALCQGLAGNDERRV
ncbi:MAG: hypothetical protein JW940_09060 [Polyangiaceae bacterium]|nr:hypothetical protein [Polyangiaceae bacterium]